MPLTTTEPLPDYIHRLARTAQVAGWGDGEVMPGWLEETADSLRAAARDLDVRAADARRDQAVAASGELVGAGQ